MAQQRHSLCAKRQPLFAENPRRVCFTELSSWHESLSRHTLHTLPDFISHDSCVMKVINACTELILCAVPQLNCLRKPYQCLAGRFQCGSCCIRMCEITFDFELTYNVYNSEWALCNPPSKNKESARRFDVVLNIRNVETRNTPFRNRLLIVCDHAGDAKCM